MKTSFLVDHERVLDVISNVTAKFEQNRLRAVKCEISTRHVEAAPGVAFGENTPFIRLDRRQSPRIMSLLVEDDIHILHATHVHLCNNNNQSAHVETRMPCAPRAVGRPRQAKL